MEFMICEAPLDNSFQKERLELVNKGSLGRRRRPSRSYLKLHLSPSDQSSQQGSPLFDQRSLSEVKRVLPFCNGVLKAQTPSQSPQSRSKKEPSLPRTIPSAPKSTTPASHLRPEVTSAVKRKNSDVGRSAVLIQTWERRTRFDEDLKKQQLQKHQQQQQLRNRFEDKENKPNTAMPASCICKYRGNLELDGREGHQNGGRFVRGETCDEVKKFRCPTNGQDFRKHERQIHRLKSQKKTQEEIPEWISLSRKLCAKFVEDHLDNSNSSPESPSPTDDRLTSKPENKPENSSTKKHVETRVAQPIHKEAGIRQKAKYTAVTVAKQKKSVDNLDSKPPEEPPWINLSRKLCTKFIEEHLEYPKETVKSKPESQPVLEPNGDVRIIEKFGNNAGSRRTRTRKPEEPEWIKLSRKLRAKFIESHIDDPDAVALDNQLNVSDPEETGSESLSDFSHENIYRSTPAINKVCNENQGLQRKWKSSYFAEPQSSTPLPAPRPKEEICWEYIETELPASPDSTRKQNGRAYDDDDDELQEQQQTNDILCNYDPNHAVIPTDMNDECSCCYSPKGLNQDHNDSYSSPHSAIISTHVAGPNHHQRIRVMEDDMFQKKETTSLNNQYRTFNETSKSYEKSLQNGDLFSEDRLQLKNGTSRNVEVVGKNRSQVQFNEQMFSRNFTESQYHVNDVIFDSAESDSPKYYMNEASPKVVSNKITVEFHNRSEPNLDESCKSLVVEDKNVSVKKEIDGAYFNLSTWEEAHYHSGDSDDDDEENGGIDEENGGIDTKNNLQKNPISKSMNTIFNSSENMSALDEGQNGFRPMQVKKEYPQYQSESALSNLKTESESASGINQICSQSVTRLSKVTLKCQTSFNRSRHQILEVNNSPKRKQHSSEESLNETILKTPNLQDSNQLCDSSNRMETNNNDKYHNPSEETFRSSTETVTKCLNQMDNSSNMETSKDYKCPNGHLSKMEPNQNYKCLREESFRNSTETITKCLNFSDEYSEVNDLKVPPLCKRKYISLSDEALYKNEYANIESPRAFQELNSDQKRKRSTIELINQTPKSSDAPFSNRMVNHTMSDAFLHTKELSPEVKQAKTDNDVNFVTPQKSELDLTRMDSGDCKPTLNKIISRKSNSIDCLQETFPRESFEDESFSDSKIFDARDYTKIKPMVVVRKPNDPKINFETFEYEMEVPISAQLVSKQNGADFNTRSSCSSVSMRNESPYSETANSVAYEDMFKESASCPSDSETSSWTVMKKNTYYVNGRSSSMNDLDFSDCSLSVKCDYASSSNQSTIQSRRSSCASSSFYVNLRDYDSHMLEPSLSRKKDQSKSHSVNGNMHNLSVSNPPTPETLRNLFTSPLKSLHQPQNRITSKIITRMPTEANQHHYYSIEPSSSSKHLFGPKAPKPKKTERSSSIKIKDIAHGIILTFRRFQNHSKTHVSPSHYVDVSHLAKSGPGAEIKVDSDKGKKKNSNSKNRKNSFLANGKTDSDSGCATADSYLFQSQNFGGDMAATRVNNEFLRQELLQSKNPIVNEKKKVKNGKKGGDKSKKNKGKSYEARAIPTVSRKVQQMADGTLYLVTTVSGDSTMPGVYSDSPDTSSELSLSRPIKLGGESNC